MHGELWGPFITYLDFWGLWIHILTVFSSDILYLCECLPLPTCIYVLVDYLPYFSSICIYIIVSIFIAPNSWGYKRAKLVEFMRLYSSSSQLQDIVCLIYIDINAPPFCIILPLVLASLWVLFILILWCNIWYYLSFYNILLCVTLCVSNKKTVLSIFSVYLIHWGGHTFKVSLSIVSY